VKNYIKKYSYITSFILIFEIILINQAYSQKTIVKGKVIDFSTNEVIPFVNIAFKNSTIGTVTELDGTFSIESTKKVDSMSIVCIGYQSQTIAIKKSISQEITIELVPSDYTLGVVTVLPGENPAHPIFRNIQKYKKQNNPEKLEFFQCEVYNKLQIDLNNITDDLKKRKVFKNFQFIFELEDSSTEMGKTYLPVFISENYSQYYFQRKPERRKEIVVASKISGIENKSYTEFTGQMYIDINLYDNYVNVFGKQFVSPFSNTGLIVYKYYLLDSTIIDNQLCYHLSYKPKRQQERTFYGEFWVSAKNYGIKKVNARLSGDANINYVKDFIINQEFTFFGDSLWFKTKDEAFTDINLADKSQGFFGRKQTIYKNLDVSKPQPEDFFSSTQVEESVITDSVNDTNIEEWNALRPEKLTVEQEQIYDMVDSVKNVPLFRTVTDIVYMLAYGYYLYKDCEFGPYFKTYSFNPIEGNRFRFGGRTSNEFSTKIMLYGHIAYGTKDQKFKYGLGALYMFKKNPRLSLDLFYENDLYLLGQSVNAFSEDNFLASILAIRPNDNLLYLQRYRMLLNKEWFTGFSTELRMFYGNILPSEKIPFKNEIQGLKWDNLKVSEIGVNTRFAFNEKVIRGEFEKVSLGSLYPILNLELTAGLKNVFSSDFEYYRLRFTLSHLFDTKPFGYLKYSLGFGKIWGTLPFPLLVLHEGNETYAMDTEAYNLMNYYEFGSDYYQSIYLEQHFQGFFLNKVPVLRKLKWREIIYAKFLNGSVNPSNKTLWDFPQTLQEITTPYAEAGIGIENIFKIIRIDAIWRITNLDNNDIQKFSIRAKLQLIF